MNFRSPLRFNLKIVFWVVLLLLILYRYYVLVHFGFRYTDSDQSVMWEGTADYAAGRFYEPRFYGQSYSSMLESLFAIPFYKAGMALKFALPLVTTLFTLLPYFLLARITFNRKSQLSGILILGFAMAMPLEYDFITSLSRGFVPGIAISGLLFLLLFRKINGAGWFFAGFIAVMSYSVNANSVVLVLPVLLHLWFNNIKCRKLYIFGSLGASLGICCHFLIQHFYVLHPEVSLHTYEIEYSLNYLKQGITDFELFFGSVSPVTGIGWLLIPFSIIGSVLFFIYGKSKEGLVALSLPILMILPLCISKVHDGNDSVFFSLARMYLGIPVVCAFILSLVNIKSLKIVFGLLALFMAFGVYKIVETDSVVARELKKQTVISVMKNSDLLVECGQLSKITQKYKIDLVVIADHWHYDFYNYNCALCTDKFPLTIRPSYDRRIWRVREVVGSTYENILIISLSRDFSNEFPSIVKLPEMEGVYLLSANKIRTDELLIKLHIPRRAI